MSTETGLSLGSNVGDRLGCLRAAAAEIGAISGVTIAARSRVYETEPMDAPAWAAVSFFLNAVLIIESELPVPRLFEQLLDVEKKLGRTRDAGRNLPRTMDIDIVYAGRTRIRTPSLTVPHPRWRTRRFVVQPLADVRPNLIIPGETLSVKELLETLPDSPSVRLFAARWD